MFKGDKGDDLRESIAAAAILLLFLAALGLLSLWKGGG
jgi:hypothetical protein